MDEKTKHIKAEFIKDEEAYRKFKRLVNLPILNEKSLIISSSGDEINLAWLQHYFNTKIADLPEEEQQLMLRKKSLYHRLLLKMLTLRKKAMGGNMGSLRGANHPLLLEPKSEEMIELFGRMFSPEEVHKIVVDEWGLPASLAHVLKFRVLNLNTISAKIEKYKQEYSDIRLGVKRSRLEELVWMYNRLKDKYKANESREDIRIMKDLLEQVRKEVEGDVIKFDGNMDINIESTVSVHLQQEVFKELNLNHIIIGRIASKMGIESYDIIKSLQDSYYSRFNDMLDTDDVNYEEIEYPSAMPYDFDKIRQVHHRLEKDKPKRKQAEKEAKDELKEKASKTGQKGELLKMLSRKIAENKSKRMEAEESDLKRKIRILTDEVEKK